MVYGLIRDERTGETVAAFANTLLSNEFVLERFGYYVDIQNPMTLREAQGKLPHGGRHYADERGTVCFIIDRYYSFPQLVLDKTEFKNMDLTVLV